MTVLRFLLWPFSILYGGIMLLRNWLYDKGWLRSQRFDLPVISVGNLTVGGTGKTPHVEYLLRLAGNKKAAVLSRGYQRKSKGFVLADEHATAETLGDEPFQYHRDFPDAVVAVCESRPAGIAQLLDLQPATEVVILDDAMQHRPVSPSLNLMLTDYGRPFYKDHVLPTGLLREPRQGARRADAVIVTKCPADLTPAKFTDIALQVKRYSRSDTPVFFSAFRYGNPVGIGKAPQLSKYVLVLTGIANARPLLRFLTDNGYEVVQHLEYPDHHNYTLADLEKLQALVEGEQGKELSIITTRKDAVKLTDGILANTTSRLPIFYVPIEVYFLQQGEAFDAMIRQHISSFQV
ncbi:tetraacyldisaccharide 4'-kinase [Pontibacter sp. HSC-14F20]|uniref:tetraacyldisaccharide 4'-kinase n=1 Tax=Pontibacter sp. HSC-14F20 TaxID=2864136 RepID=UPI001C734D7B|nr:tetraacyldisaccharide 4'-kinase [Pontibacter sp. HSC-14F20]MBX0332063.1 tetraacyldisaccharide 4'-kinase [Pontibacter sp. HSC-14F20]